MAEGTPTELKDRISGQRLDLDLIDRTAFEQVVSVLGSRVAEKDPDLLTIGVPTDGSAAPSRDRIAKFNLHSATLDDVFLTLTGSSAKSSTSTRVKETVGDH